MYGRSRLSKAHKLDFSCIISCTIFQGLGLQAFLTSCLQLGAAQHTVIYSKEYRAVVVKQRVSYVAFLLCYTNAGISGEFIRWAQTFEPTQLRTDDRFSSV